MGRSNRSAHAGSAPVVASFCTWRLITFVAVASLIMLISSSQLLLLGNGCLAEKERAVHAEDLVLQFQRVREEERQTLEKQIVDLQAQLAQAQAPSRLAALSPPQTLGNDGDQKSIIKVLQEEVSRERQENEQLRNAMAISNLKAGSPGFLAPSPPLSQPQILAQRSAASGASTGGQGLITEDLLRSFAADGAIGVAVITCKRPKYLQQTMDAVLSAQRNPEQFPIVISQDAYDGPMMQMVQKSYVETNIAYHMHHDHDPDAQTVAKKYGGAKAALGYVYIAQHFGWVMKRMFDDFGFQSVIFLEEDLRVSPDFFSYFGTMAKLLRSDQSLYCVSAWNDNGYAELVQDPDLAYRTEVFPGLGWMMDKSLWGELRDRWAAAYWDEFMRRPDVRKGRSCIRPEISRSYTFGEEGTSSGQFFKQHLAKIKLNDVNVDWAAKDLSRLGSQQAFEEDFASAVRAAVPVTLQDVDAYAGRSMALRIEYVDAQYKVSVAKKFNLMPDEKEGMRRDSYRGVIPFAWQTNRIYLYTAKWPGHMP